jgi:hypothetical protein
MGNKTWTDQPDDVLEAETMLGSFKIVMSKVEASNATVEIRRKATAYPNRPYDYLVSFGTLFGSQTLQCKSAEQVLAVLCCQGTDRSLPLGVALLDNHKE